MTSANMIGVSSGTRSSRGVRTVSWKRRCASVASRRSIPARRGNGRVIADEMADMALLSGDCGEPVAGQPQVDVVEGRADRERVLARDATRTQRSEYFGRVAVCPKLD